MLRKLAPCHLALAVCIGSLVAGGSGCEQKSSGAAASKPTPTVTVIEPVERELADFAEFTGWTDAVESVEIRARVSGYLQEIPFKAGREVAAGDVLFQIDPRTYQAEVERSKGLLANAQARFKRASADLEREKALREKGINAQTDLDLAIAQQAEAAAAIQSSQASLDRAELDLGFTKVTAPVAGQTSRERMTVGNLVSADSTMLTTIVSLDPIYAYFDVDERMMLEIQKRIRERKMKSARQHDVEVRMGLANETGFPHVGVIDLVDNRVSATTGTLQVRAKFPNLAIDYASTAEDKANASDTDSAKKVGEEKLRILTPGLFVRIHFQIGPPGLKRLIPEQALAQQQGQRYVFVVTPDNKVERRNVTIGRKDDSWRVVETGLQSGERVIVQGHQRVRPGMEVKPDPFKVATAVPDLSSADATDHKAAAEKEASKSKEH